MIWADRLGVVWAMIASILLLVILPNLHGTAAPVVYAGFPAFLIVVGTPWLLLRALHFVIAGGRS